MELKNIKYKSAVYFGVFALVMYFVLGVLQLILISQNPLYAAMAGVGISTAQLLVYTPLIGAVVVYLSTLLAILVYNIVAKSWPIAWELKK